MARDSQDKFQNKIAIVTGGASGIGEAICADLTRRGATVIVADVDAAGAARVASEICGDNGCASAATVDVSKASDLETLVKDVAAEHGRLDFMFNNAGISMVGEVRDMSVEQWRKIVDVNLMGVVHGTSAAYPVMIQQGDGHIVNAGSILGLIPLPISTAYSATKAAIVAFSHALRVEAANLGVRVSVVCPGFVDTGIYHAAEGLGFDSEQMPEQDNSWMMTPAEAAKQILQGTAANRRTIVFPFSARLSHWGDRLRPGIFARSHRKLVDGFRELRDAAEETSTDEQAAGSEGQDDST